MYPEITPLIRDTIKRRYELIPYIYSLMLESHMTALPPQRWIGSGYESDTEVWTAKVMSGETQYWLGDTLLVGGVYEPGETSAKLYLPRKVTREPDDGFVNLNEPYEYMQSGQWVEIKSEWRNSIPLLARVGGALIVGKNIQTRAPGDHTHPSPNVVEDDYRAIEVFPPKGESNIYSVTWYEDDGISVRPDISSFTVQYSSTTSHINVQVVKGKENKYIPIWTDIDIILPFGDQRSVISRGQALHKSKDSRGRLVFTLPLN
jgi:alpha-glucosidase (family GH31 glycosyl hydrolase)